LATASSLSQVAARRYELPKKLPPTGTPPTRGGTARPPLDGYVRVSRLGGRQGERFLSPRLQEEAIRAYARAHDAQVGRVFVELGRSGTDSRRPQLATVLARVEECTSGGVIVARLDRLGRGVTETLRLLERISAAGATFVSVEDGFDSSTPLGRALLTTLLALAELEHHRLATSWQEQRVRAVRRGVHLCPRLPLGYARGLDGRLELDPELAPSIAAAFERRARGARYVDVAAFLAQSAVPTPSGVGEWTSSSAYHLFQNPVYVGEAFSGSVRNVQAHPPLVRRAVWLAAHAASARAFSDACSESLLGGIVRCASCTHLLRRELRRGTGSPRAAPVGGRYRCRRKFRHEICSAPAQARADELEQAVIELCLGDLEARRPADDHERRLRAAEEELARLEATVQTHRGWRSAIHDTDQRDVARARAAVLSLWRQLQLERMPPASQLRREWPSLSRESRRNVLETALETAFVAPGDRPVTERLQLIFAGQWRVPLPDLNGPNWRLRPTDGRELTPDLDTLQPARRYERHAHVPGKHR
jgi:site-specific DNA recombinase